MRKSKVVILNQLNIKNNKIDKDNLKKIIKEKICRGTL
jgi:ABC-type phosphate transport system substrate-binding protein